MMAVLLKTILAICLLVEMVSTTPVRESEELKIDPTKLKRYILSLNASVVEECKKLKTSPCGNEQVRIVTFEHNEQQLCQTYSRVFFNVQCALNEFPAKCSETVSALEPHPELYSNKSTCTLPDSGYKLMKEFCPQLRRYVKSVYDCCVEEEEEAKKKKCTS